MTVSGSVPPALESTPGITTPSVRTVNKRRLGDVIVDLGYAERQQVETAVAAAQSGGRSIGQAMVETGVVDGAQLAHALAERNGLACVIGS